MDCTRQTPRRERCAIEHETDAERHWRASAQLQARMIEAAKARLRELGLADVLTKLFWN